MPLDDQVAQACGVTHRGFSGSGDPVARVSRGEAIAAPRRDRTRVLGSSEF